MGIALEKARTLMAWTKQQQTLGEQYSVGGLLGTSVNNLIVITYI
jgi:hypothetical protein